MPAPPQGSRAACTFRPGLRGPWPGLRRPTRRLSAALLAVAVFLEPGPGLDPLRADETGTLRGRVADAQGNPLAGALVTVSSRSWPAVPSPGAVANARGEYRIAGLPPAADYEVTCSLPGFSTFILRPVRISAGAVTVANFNLIEAIVETVRVEGTGSIVDTESTATSTSVGRELLADLPILGRTYTDALTLAPGVTDTDGDGNPNVKGAREVDFQLRISGVPVNDPFTGERALDFNIEAIEEIQVVTGALSAEHSSQGGIGLVSTRSGGNDFEGSFKLYYQTRSLDGDGANNNDITGFNFDPPSFRTLRPFLTAGGALRKDRLWYFATLEYIDESEPVSFGAATRLSGREGQRDFAKITWQIHPQHKATLEAYYEPTDTRGNNIGPTISEESDALIDTAGRLYTLRETAVFSPTVLLDSTLSLYALDDEIHPVSEPTLSIADDLEIYSNEAGPDPVMVNFILRNQFSVLPFDEHYLIDPASGAVRGPFWVTQSQDSRQLTLREDLSFYVDDFLGSHTLKAGVEGQRQRYDELPRLRPTVFPGLARGALVPVTFVAPVPSEAVSLEAERTNLAFYVQDAWKPLPNLTVALGVRVDREIVHAPGRSPFDPRAEVEEYNRLARTYYADPGPVGDHPDASGQVVLGTALNFDINPLTENPFCDLDGDGTCNGRVSPEGSPRPGIPPNSDVAVLRHVFSRSERDCSRVSPWLGEPSPVTGAGRECLGIGDPNRLREGRDLLRETIALGSTNVAPRASLSFDPFADGKTKLYATYGRFYGSLFLAIVASERRADFQSFSFVRPLNDPVLRRPSDGTFTIYQVSRDLRTPFTDEFTLGLERELAPELAIRAVYTSRKGRNQLQDTDINHVAVDRRGAPGGGGPDGAPDDCFDTTTENASPVSPCAPDGIPDLEALNPHFSQVFLVGNLNSSDYRSLELALSKRLHRNWQFETSYTWSEARGDAEEYLSFLGDNPSQTEPEQGFLDYDQRHVFKFSAISHLPREVSLGGTILYESGLPFSLVERVASPDNQGGFTFHTVFPTGRRNDQRNRPVWTFNASLKKGFTMGRVKAVASLDVFDILNTDDLRIFSVNLSNSAGLKISDPTDPATRQFGRRFQVGIELHF